MNSPNMLVVDGHSHVGTDPWSINIGRDQNAVTGLTKSPGSDVHHAEGELTGV